MEHMLACLPACHAPRPCLPPTPLCFPLPCPPAAVEGALLAVAGVLAASVSLTLDQAEVQYSEAACSPAALVAAVEAAGFEAAGECWRQEGPGSWECLQCHSRLGSSWRGLCY
jgi:copper chaperone CopZ